MKIGFQGVSGSNSEAAAIKMAESNGFTDVEYVPLISSKGVIDALERGQIDMGLWRQRTVLAVRFLRV